MYVLYARVVASHARRLSLLAFLPASLPGTSSALALTHVWISTPAHSRTTCTAGAARAHAGATC